MIELGKSRDRNIKYLTPEDLEKLFSVIDMSNEIGLRDRALLEVLFSTGLRVSELAALNKDQININEGEFGVIGKAGNPVNPSGYKTAYLWEEMFQKDSLINIVNRFANFSAVLSFWLIINSPPSDYNKLTYPFSQV